MKDNKQQQSSPEPPEQENDLQTDSSQSGEITPPWVNIEEDAQIEDIGGEQEAPEEPLPTEMSGGKAAKKSEKEEEEFRPKRSTVSEQEEEKPERELSESEQKTVAAQGTVEDKPQSEVEPVEKEQQLEPEPEKEPESEAPEQPEPQPARGKDFIKKSPFRKLMPLVGILLVAGLVFFVAFKIVPGLIKKGKDTGSAITGGGDTGGGTTSSKEVELTYWGLWEPESVVSKVVAEYQKEHPNVKIKYSQQSHKDYRERLQSALAKGEGPDIFRFHSTWVPMLQKELSAAPSEIASQINLSNNFFPVVAEDLQVGGQTAGVPSGFESLVLFYNTEMLKEANETPPSTWEELRSLAKKLTVTNSSGKIKKAGVALGTTNNIDNWSDVLGLMLFQNGANPAKPEGSLAGDTIRFYTLFSQSDKVWDETLPNSTYAFATKKVAMIFAPSWRAFQINEINPDLKYKAVAVPQLPGEKVAWATYWAEGVWSKSKHEKEAWKFLEYLSSQEGLITFYNATSEVRQFGEPYPRTDMVSKIEDEPVAGAVVKQGDYARSWYLSSRTWDNGINDKMIKYYQNAVNSYLEGESMSKVISTLSSGVDQVLSQYGLSSSTRE